jgi:hypothetical protein
MRGRDRGARFLRLDLTLAQVQLARLEAVGLFERSA